MTDAAWTLQTAVVARITPALAAASAAGGVVPVLQTVKQAQRKPYVTVGEDIAVPWNTLTTRGESIAFTLHAYSDQGSFAELSAILAAIKTALDGAALALEGRRLVSLRFVSAQRRNDPGDIKHGIIRFRALVG